MKKLQDFIAQVRAAVRAARSGQPVIMETAKWKPKWKIEQYDTPMDLAAGVPNRVVELPGNLLLNEGITELLTLLIGGAGTAYSNANARIGVGDSSVAAAATQTDLLAATNKLYKGMDGGYPQVTAQKVTFRATFSSTEANYAWNEITVDNGAAAGKNLNRKVQAMGTKAEPATWVVSLEITIS